MHPLDTLTLAVLPVAQRFNLQALADESRMQSLTIAAASLNPSNSPAMLITRHCGRLSSACRCLLVKDECIVVRSDSFVIENLNYLVGGQVESAASTRRARRFCGLGFSE